MKSTFSLCFSIKRTRQKKVSASPKLSGTMFPSFRSIGGVKNEMLLHSTIALKHKIITRAIGKSLIFVVAKPDFTGGDFLYHKAINIFIYLPGTVSKPVHR